MKIDRLDVTRKSVWDDPKYREKYKYPEMIDVTIKAMDSAIGEYLPRVPEFGDMANILGIAINKVISGESATSALNEAQTEILPHFSK